MGHTAHPVDYYCCIKLSSQKQLDQINRHETYSLWRLYVIWYCKNRRNLYDAAKDGNMKIVCVWFYIPLEIVFFTNYNMWYINDKIVDLNWLLWWHISAITCQIIMLTCQIFMSSCQIFMLTCQIFMLTCHLFNCLKIILKTVFLHS